MASGNPVLRSDRFQPAVVGAERMTVNGTIGKTAILLVLLVITASWTWQQFSAALSASGPAGAMAAVTPYMIGGLIAGLVLALLCIFVTRWIAVTAPMYAIAEGFAVGAISAVFNLRYPGLVVTAVALTIGTLAAMLLIYRSGLIKVTDKLRMGIVAATGGIALVYLIDLVMGMFGAHMPVINSASPLGIGFSLLVVGIAAFNLLLDFDFIERAAEQGAARNMEWYGAFGLMVTLVWLYLEILRLLSKLRR
ncbi:MAG: Bax inhibitor-1/YccA family protein [Rudaea sp.]|nr:Bax inhibitor-1/YccA family protein [Rudaea sp.]